MLPSTIRKFEGALMGLAVGDAVGTSVEFRSPGSFEPVTDMLGGGPFNLKPGQWTDDTSMALCLAESLIRKRGFDLVDQLERFSRWHQEGHLSCTGSCFDIGNTVAEALANFSLSGNPFSGPKGRDTAGNGSLMRLAPVPMLYFKTPKEAMEQSGESSRTTHQAPQAIDACKYFGGLIVGALEGRTKEELLSPLFTPLTNYWNADPLDSDVESVAMGSFKEKRHDEIVGSGYVVKTLEAALWAFHNTNDFRSGLLKVVNLGDDADTTGAVYGQLAGAYYGIGAIPAGWREKIAMAKTILEFAREINELAENNMIC